MCTNFPMHPLDGVQAHGMTLLVSCPFTQTSVASIPLTSRIKMFRVAVSLQVPSSVGMPMWYSEKVVVRAVFRRVIGSREVE